MTNVTTLTGHQLIRRGEQPEYYTVQGNSLEGRVSMLAGDRNCEAVARGHASTRTGKAAGCSGYWERRHVRRLTANGFLYVPLGNPVGRSSSECRFGLVVG